MNIPKTIEDIEKNIEMKVPESLHLDYKASPAFSPEKKDEICKDVSAFANSDGGMLIYGIREEKVNKIGYPASIDDGIDTSKFGKEWIDQVLTSNIRPVLSGVEIVEIKLAENRSVMVIHVPKSFRGPHQSPDKKYYKRRNVVSEPMEHYEIEDVRNRRQIFTPLVTMNAYLSERKVYLFIENIGEEVAHNVKFHFSNDFSWYKGQEERFPNALKNGIKFLAPNKRITFFVGAMFPFLRDNSEYDSFFDVSITYQYQQSEREIREDIHIDLKDYLYSEMESDYLKRISEHLSDLKEITHAIGKINDSLKNIERISGATGLNLSISSLTNLWKILRDDDSFKHIKFEKCDMDIIQEVLDVDFDTAYKIYYHYHDNRKETSIEEISGMTGELLEKIKKHMK
ncbi:helix-turn-helix domain-containing protein [Candidatus Electronema sp. JM]|uniref:AlbA family DNA-binding domain-containing protein n=1 Tax=Candidatus Electronema sp. JM TaxID=3401571 RepID=UPI003AA92DF5